jgi:tetratricopeptide (TPR) repeat protein
MSLIRLVLWIVVGVTALTGRTALAAGDSDDRTAAARKLFELGMGRFQLDEWDAAIAYWEEGFRNKPAPELLYNIAQAHRRAHRPDKALTFYQKYLRLSPDAANRADVERIIATLEHTAPAAAPATATDAQVVPVPITTESPPRPLARRPWFWAVIGGGVAVVAAAVVVGVVVGGQAHDSAQSLPAVSFGLRL